MKITKIRITSEGQPIIEDVIGAGKGCLAHTEKLEQRLGVAKDRSYTDEYYNEVQNEQKLEG